MSDEKGQEGSGEESGFDSRYLLAAGAGMLAALLILYSLLAARDSLAPAPIQISTAEPPPTIAPTGTEAPTATASPLTVFVNGEVKEPAVYTIPAGSRIQQAIDAAGGFTDQANAAVVNLAHPLTDGMQIYVPSLAGSTPLPPQVISEPQHEGRSGELNLGQALVNVNTATSEELQALPGIGPALAQRILEYRSANGRFADAESLLDVSGIGPAKLEAIRDLITTDN